MQYKEFLDLLNEMQPGDKRYFKPGGETVLNAYEPTIKPKIFELTFQPDNSYKVRYIAIMQEFIYNKAQMEQLFEAKNWYDFIPFDLAEDYFAWQKRA